MYTAYTIRQLHDASLKKKAKLNVPNTSDGMQTITFKPLDPGIVLEKLVVDYGGLQEILSVYERIKDKRTNLQ